MAANPTQIHREFPDIVVRGSNVVPITQSNVSPGGMDMGIRRDICMERREGSGSNFGETGQMDRRSKYRAVKYAAKVTKDAAKAVDKGMQPFDIAWLLFCLGFGGYLAVQYLLE
jgi:hypothetical protein